ncbi:dolichol-phosphate mannosyltransferase [Nematocida sp. AWRm77]|nr:dolichol-phosphate mannosyltransferase [Nematocida sp. AWRm77]
MEISIVLPTHNEKSNALLLVHCIDKVMKDTACEIIIVDDGSTDGTSEACSALQPRIKCPLKVLTRPTKLGLGSAYKRGVEHTSGKYVVFMDADLSHDPRDIPRLLQKISSRNTCAGVVLGSRYRAHGGVSAWPLFRRVTSRGANMLARLFTGKQNTDMTNSFRIYKTDVLKSGIKSVRSTGFSYQMEILYRCNAPVEEIPVKFHERVHGHSKLGPLEYVQFLKWGVLMLLERAAASLSTSIYEKEEIF